MKLFSSHPSYHQSLLSSLIYFRPPPPNIPRSSNQLCQSNHDITTLLLLVTTLQRRQSCSYYIFFFTLIIPFPSAHLNFSITHINLNQTIVHSRPCISSTPPTFLYFIRLYLLLPKNLSIIILFHPNTYFPDYIHPLNHHCFHTTTLTSRIQHIYPRPILLSTPPPLYHTTILNYTACNYSVQTL